MAIRFIHTGDWHLAKSFGRFAPDKQTLLRDARARIVENVGQLARTTSANFVLVAGDIFDSPFVSDDVLRRLVARLGQFSDIQWHFLPGNHDPATPNGIWHRFSEFVSAPHIVIHTEARVYPIADHVDLLVAPLKTKTLAHDPTEWMISESSNPATIRIGLAHGSIQGFGTDDEASVPIAPDRATSANLDYLALGDWHGVRQINPKTWYAGTPEPEQFPDNEPGYALSIHIGQAGALPEVERHWLGLYLWQRHTIERNPLAALQELERALATDASAGNTLLNITVTGEVSLDEELAIRDRVSRLSDLTFHVDADLDRLLVSSGAASLDLIQDPVLKRVASRLLSALAEQTDGTAVPGSSTPTSNTATAHKALLLLSRLASRQGST